MAKGYNEHQERLHTLSLFGKDLARRSKSTCELSGQSGVALKIYEVAPVPNQPDYDRCLFLSEQTISQLEQPKQIRAEEWRILGELIWSELIPVQVMAHRILTHISQSHSWAQEILEEAFLDEEVIQWAEKVKL